MSPCVECRCDTCDAPCCDRTGRTPLRAAGMRSHRLRPQLPRLRPVSVGHQPASVRAAGRTAARAGQRAAPCMALFTLRAGRLRDDALCGGFCWPAGQLVERRAERSAPPAAPGTCRRSRSAGRGGPRSAGRGGAGRGG